MLLILIFLKISI